MNMFAHAKVLLKKLLPSHARLAIRQLMKFFLYRWRRFVIRGPVARNEPLKIIVGAAETWQPGWYSTNEQWLNISKREDWDKVFHGKRLITHIVAEHVFEHLTPEECRRALAHMADHLVHSGRIRIAVPDGYHPDPVYLRHVGINGIADDAADHKQLLNAESLCAFLHEAGFEATLLEGYDKSRNFVARSYSPEDGFISRSIVNRDPQARPLRRVTPNALFPDYDTSLIVDGVKTAPAHGSGVS